MRTRHLIKTMRVMRLTSLFLLAAGLQVSAKTLSQTVTFSGERVPLVKVFNEVKKQTGFLVAYNDQVLRLAKPVSISVKDEPVEKFMGKILQDQPFEYTIEGNTIFIRRKSSPVTGPASEISPPKVFKGRVLAEDGAPLQGVTVRIKGVQGGTSTDANGLFTITSDKSSLTLIFSYVGYAETEVVIAGSDAINIVLHPKTKGMDEAVVVGYGTVKKGDVTTAVATVTSKQLENRPVMNALEAMAGQLSGVDIQQGGGQPGGESTKIRVRGTNSISGSSDPLYVVDGMPMPNALNSISVNDIDNITVLKDVSATAIYGSRGSSGVVLITTKKGKTGQPAISVNSSVGMQQIARKIPMMGKDDYLQLLLDSKNNSWVDRDPVNNKATDDNATRQAHGAAGSIKYIIPDGKSNPWGTFKYNILDPADVAKMPNTDWQDEIYRNALVTQNEISLSGGAGNTRYIISGNYAKQDGIIVNSTYQRFNVRSRLESKIRKNLTVGFQLLGNSNNGRLQAQGRNETLGGWGVDLAALSMAPVFPVKNPNGTYADMQRNPDILGAGQPGFNPLEMANNRYRYKKNYGWSVFTFAEWEIIPNLKYKFTFNQTSVNNENSFFEPQGVNDYGVTTTGTTSSNAQDRTRSYLIENLMTYNKTIADKHNFSLLGGYTIENAQLGYISAAAANGASNYVQLVSGTPVTAITGASEYSLQSYLGRLMYNFSQRYLLTGTVRWDGSSRFSPGHKWGFFPSISAGWNISKESFMENVKIINDLKIRGGWGISGNNNIGNFEWQGNMGGNRYPVGSTQVALLGVPPGTKAQNDQLTWEKTREFNVGFDLSILNNRITISGDYYVRTSYDLLLSLPTPILTGQTSYLTNMGKMRNKGVELTLSTRNIIGPIFSWSTDFNISHNDNKVLSLGPGNTPIFPASKISGGPWFRTAVGYPLSTFWGYQVAGIFRDDADLARHTQYAPGKDRPGQFYYQDVSGPNGKPDGVIDVNDRTAIGNNNPKFTAGMTNHFAYKDLSLDIQLNASYGGHTYNLLFKELVKGTDGSRGAPKYLLDRWKSPTDPGNGKIPAVTSVGRGLDGNGSSYWVQDNSYLRIRNVTLSYDLSSKLPKKYNIQRLRVYASVYNLYTFTKYLGYDPEANTSYYYDSPDGTGGSQVSGADYLAYPTSRTYSLGINLTF